MARERTPAELQKMEANRAKQLAAKEAERWRPVRSWFLSYEDRTAGTDKPRADMAHCPRCGTGRLLGYEGDDPEDRQRAWEEFLKEHDRPHTNPHSLAGRPWDEEVEQARLDWERNKDEEKP